MAHRKCVSRRNEIKHETDKIMEKTQPLVYFLLAKKNSNIEHITFSNRENISLRSRVRGCFFKATGLLGGLAS